MQTLIFLDISGDAKTGGFMVIEEDVEVEGAFDLVNSTSLGAVSGAKELNEDMGYDVVSFDQYENGEEGIIDFSM